MLDKYVDLLKSGEIVAFPTETVYGLGADARNPDAIQKVFYKKGRPSDNPLIVHIASRKTVPEFALEIPAAANKLMDSFWPGPLTLIFKKKPEVLDLITAGLPTVALRWPNHPLSQDLIAQAGPLVAPSANSSGKPSPTKPEHVLEDFGDDFPCIDAGTTQIGLESTVLDISSTPIKLYRPGAIGKSEIEQVVDQEVIVATEYDNAAAISPGTKYSHYAPNAAVRWMEPEEETTASDTLYIYHHMHPNIDSDHIIFYDADYKKMAQELYDRFRQADHRELRQVVIEPFPLPIREENPVANALVNRISKAIGYN